MRLPLVIGCAGLACTSLGDRLINIPLGRKIPYRSMRLESRFEMSALGSSSHWVGVGVGTSFDVDLHARHSQGTASIFTFDLSYNYVSPIVDITPGFSVGVQDALDRTPEGRRMYLAMTYRLGTDHRVPLELTLGLTHGALNAGFVGVMLPFTEQLRLMTEHDGYRVSAGLEWRPARSLGLRLLVQERATMAGLSFSHRF